MNLFPIFQYLPSTERKYYRAIYTTTLINLGITVLALALLGCSYQTKEYPAINHSEKSGLESIIK